MAIINDGVLYSITSGDLNEARGYIVPINVHQIEMFFDDYAGTSIQYLVIRDNVEYISDNAFKYTKVNGIFISNTNDNYRTYIDTIKREVRNYKIKNVYFIKSSYADIGYYDFAFEEDAIYTGKSIFSLKKINHTIFMNSDNELVDNGGYTTYEDYPYFNNDYYLDFNYKYGETNLLFKIKKDSDGYLFAIDCVNYENNILQRSSTISEMSAGIAFGTIRLASNDEKIILENMDKFRNRKHKKAYLSIVNNMLLRVSYIRKPNFDYQEVKITIDKKRKSNFIEDVRTLLLKVADINIDIYKQYFNKFDEILYLGSTNEIESKLINLYAELQLYLSCGIITFSENSNLVDNINKLTNDYYDRLIENKGTEEDIIYQPESIDVLANLVIKNISNMTYLEVDNISKSIAFMYFAEIKLARENDGKIDLKNNPYLEYFKKYIYYIIKTMIINGYVKTNVDINIETIDIIKLIEKIDISSLKKDIKKKVLTFNIN